MRYFGRISCLFLFGILVSCSTDEGNTGTMEDSETPEPMEMLTAIELEFIEEYEYITFNLAPDSFGANVNEKWVTDVSIFLDGTIPDNYTAGVEEALARFNPLLSAGISFRLVNTLEESNIHLIFGEKEAIQEIWPDMFDAIGNVNFKGYALYNGDGDFNITEGRIWVRTASVPLFAHELGHTIGLGHSSGSYCEGNLSLNQSFMCSFLKEEFSIFDKAIIQTLYNPKVEVGQTFSQLKPIIEELLLTDVILVE